MLISLEKWDETKSINSDDYNPLQWDVFGIRLGSASQRIAMRFFL